MLRLEIFLVNEKLTIIGFGYRSIGRILMISEGLIPLGRYITSSSSIILFYCSFKIFRRYLMSLMASIPWLTIHSQQALNIFERGRKYTVDSTHRSTSFPGNGAAASLFMLELTNRRKRRFEDERAEIFPKTERKKNSGTLKILFDGSHLLFKEYLEEKKPSVYILKLCR